jgi:hypothetical protein
LFLCYHLYKNRWNERTVYDLQVCADGWTMLTTGPRRRRTEEAGSREDGDQDGVLVSLYHAKSGQALSFHAQGGCFRANLQQALLVWRDADRSTEEPVWAVTAVDLADIRAYWSARADSGAPAAPPADVSNKAWWQPVNLQDPGALASQWSLQLQSAELVEAAGSATARDRVGAAALDVTSNPAAPALRVVSRAAGALLYVSLKSLSQALTSHSQPTEASVAHSTEVAGLGADSFRCLAPAPPLHVWSVGKLMYILTKGGLLHQCNVGAAVPQYVGAAPLPLPQAPPS